MAKTVKTNCNFCKKEFIVREAEIKRGFGKYCSKSCSSKKVPEKHKCSNCDKIFKGRRKKKFINYFCSRSCSISYLNKNKERKPIGKKGIENIILGNKMRSGSLEYDKNPNKCFKCKKVIEFKRRKNKHCSNKCRRDNIKSISQYRTRCLFKFSLNSYPIKFNFNLIDKYGWYSPTNKNNNLNGVSRDHMFSVRNGFELGIDPKIIAHPANCKLMKHTDNFKKKSKSSIPLSMLLYKIEEWDNK